VDVLFHPRGRNFGSGRNWGADRWEALLLMLKANGLRTGCLGLRSATVPVRGDFLDFRDRPLAETLDVIASARAVLGPSSGPLHLASLCGTPHLVWTDRGRHARGRTNRDKYEWWWNPLKTPAWVLDEHGFDPEPAAVAESLGRLLASRP
jgi:ADP-heptose:LPS heptosyltransferase